jgi:signal transduction histidine kinase
MSRMISKPILKIANSAINITEKGIRNKKIIYKNNDEIGILVNAFNNMVENLDKTMTSRENLVKEINNRKKAQELLKKSHEKLRNLFSHVQFMIEKERVHTAREIHDELGQSLTAQKMELYLLRKKIKDDRLCREMDSIVTNTNHIIKTVQKITSELRPSLLDNLSLSAAIKKEIREFEERNNIYCEVSIIPDEIIIDKNSSITVFRIFQEAMTNIVRHSKATKVNIELGINGQSIKLAVSDNGKGITKDQISDPKSFGIIGMLERCYALQGQLKIKGIAGKGTKLNLSFKHNSNGDK